MDITKAANDVAVGWQSLPEPIQRNFIQAANKLITGLVDVPASYLAMKSAELKAKEHGHALIMEAAAKNAAQLAGQSPEIAERALDYCANQLVREQSNREAVVKQALLAAPTLPSPKPDAQIPSIDQG